MPTDAITTAEAKEALVREITACRSCGSTSLFDVLDLGSLPLSAVFPAAGEPDPPSAPIRLLKCEEPTGCGLVQLAHTVASDCMYATAAYGYRSGINETMSRHLQGITAEIEQRQPLSPGDVVLDIGSNDATLLRSYRAPGVERIGIDPTSEQYSGFYGSEIARAATYFTRDSYRQLAGSRQARVVTSIAMFYDLDDPNAFVADVADCLAPDGLWVLEQSYMPTMLRMNSFDTLCHEHLEYYRLSDIQRLCERHGLAVCDVSFSEINGGSFRLFVRRAGAGKVSESVAAVEYQERAAGLDTPRPYGEFAQRVARVRETLATICDGETRSGRVTMAYGASTKGNIILSYVGLNSALIAAAAERNPLKYGRRTPGSGIPIIPEAEARAARPDTFLALPWSFLPSFVAREREYLARGGRFLVPLPDPEFRT